MNGANIEFKFAPFQSDWCVANTAFEIEGRWPLLEGRAWREIHFPKIEGFIHEGYAVGVRISLGADLSDDADFG